MILDWPTCFVPRFPACLGVAVGGGECAAVAGALWEESAGAVRGRSAITPATALQLRHEWRGAHASPTAAEDLREARLAEPAAHGSPVSRTTYFLINVALWAISWSARVVGPRGPSILQKWLPCQAARHQGIQHTRHILGGWQRYRKWLCLAYSRHIYLSGGLPLSIYTPTRAAVSYSAYLNFIDCTD